MTVPFDCPRCHGSGKIDVGYHRLLVCETCAGTGSQSGMELMAAYWLGVERCAKLLQSFSPSDGDIRLGIGMDEIQGEIRSKLAERLRHGDSVLTRPDATSQEAA